MPRHRSRRPAAPILPWLFVVALCVLIGYFSYHLLFVYISLDHRLARTVISLGIPIAGEREQYSPGWEYTLRSFIYLITDFDLGNPDTLLRNTIPFLDLFESRQTWQERPFVFIPELTFDPDPTKPLETRVQPPSRATAADLAPQVCFTAILPNVPGPGSKSSANAMSSVLPATGQSRNHGSRQPPGGSAAQPGSGVIHSAIHDWPTLSGAYVNSERTVKTILAQNPGIRFVFDVHRDANVPDRTVVIDGRQVARVLLVVATAQSIPQSHPHWEKNYEFALDFYRTAERMYPGLMRPMQIRRDARYNQHLHQNSILIEIGSVENTIEEALLAAELVATVIAEML